MKLFSFQQYNKENCIFGPSMQHFSTLISCASYIAKVTLAGKHMKQSSFGLKERNPFEWVEGSFLYYKQYEDCQQKF